VPYVAVAVHDQPFDPLIDFDGLWTPELAEHYLPIEGAPPARYEAVNGKLVMSRREGSANSWASAELLDLLRRPARAAGYAMYNALNVQLGLKTWIEPDLVVLVEQVVDLTWIPADKVLMPIELVSPSSRRRDRIDKPRLAAAAGIPFYLRVEIARGLNSAELHLFELFGGEYKPVTSAVAGEQFRMERPFEVSFDPNDLLEH
jgi:Uma2 family endonuclease